MSPSKYHENYPQDWPAIATLIKQANRYTCQMCGRQCTRPGEPYDRRRVLTVAHYFNDYSSEEIFVACICNLCHFHHDRGLGQAFRRRNEHWRRLRAGQLAWGWAEGLGSRREVYRTKKEEGEDANNGNAGLQISALGP